ncbi:GNAT family N-acetyltransferase [bacterium]|nr:GNAT family N-acetyltransferase [bacterium]
MIQKAKKEDSANIIALIELNSGTFPKQEICAAKKSIKKIIKKQDKENKFYIATISKKIVGCGGFSKRNDTSGVYSLNWLAIHPDFKREGIATDLYKFIETSVQKLDARLIILSAGSNEENQHFYKKMGFKSSARIPKYYNKTKDLLWYYKHL